MFHYDRSLLLSSFVEVLCCDVISVPHHSVNGKSFFLRGAPFLWCVCVEYYSMYGAEVYFFHFSVEDR